MHYEVFYTDVKLHLLQSKHKVRNILLKTSSIKHYEYTYNVLQCDYSAV